MDYTNIFEEGKIGKQVLKNRIIYSPVGENMANTDGSFSEQSIAYYTEKAKGGAAMIMPGAVAVEYPVGKSHSVAHRIDQLKYTKNMHILARNVHAYDCLIVPQLQHAGARTTFKNTDGEMPRCVSDIEPQTTAIKKCRAVGPQKELTTEEIKALPTKYVTAARYCQMAGCDGVEIHMAHSFLLNEFLSPDTNKRVDEYGGTLTNRMRLPLDIVRAVREACGNDFIISARIPGKEFVSDGLTAEECQKIAVNLEKAGCDVLNVSVGMTVDQVNIREPQGTEEGARLSGVANIRDAVSIPVMTAGTFRTPEFCDKILREDKVDFILMARQLICDPLWPNKAAAGKTEEIRPCLTCNAGCFDALVYNRPVGCVLNPIAGNEYENAELQKSTPAQRIMVIGGGIAGMQAAITATRRGNEVTIFEKSDTLGGQMKLACIPPGKESIGRACQWFIEETVRAGVTIKTNETIDMTKIKAENPDKIIFASGALPWAPGIPGMDLAMCSWDVLNGQALMPEGKAVAVIGGGLVGCETGLLLQQHGNKVNIIEMAPAVAAALEEANREHLLNELAAGGAEIFTDTTVKEITDTAVLCEQDGGKVSIEADAVILAIGQRPAETELAKQLKADGYHVAVIGDARKPAGFGEATMAGYMAAKNI